MSKDEEQKNPESSQRKRKHYQYRSNDSHDHRFPTMKHEGLGGNGMADLTG